MTFQASGSFQWYLQAIGCTLQPLWTAPHVCSSTQALQSAKTCYLIAGSSGQATFTMTVQPNAGATATLSNLMLFARKTGVMLPVPTSSPGIDPQNWAQTVDNIKGRTQKWVTGYKVRYAVSYCTPYGEGSKGPWSEWIEGAPWALPTLIDVPTGLSGVSGRKIYRQFDGFDEELVGSIDNNTDTRFPEDTL